MLFLTAKDATEDKVTGLTIGGDDYVTKPFSLEEVIARIRAVLRRARSGGPPPPPTRLRAADLELDEESHEVWRAGERVQLSPTEFKLLRYLMTNAGRVLSKAQILDHVWNYDFRGDSSIVESVRLLPAPQGRRGRAAADPHHPQRRLRPAAARPMTPRPLAAAGAVAARTPLQVKLIVAVLALVAVALALIGLASVAAVDGLLVGRLDRELHQEAAARPAGRPPPSFAGPGPAPRGPRSPYLVQYRDADGRLEKELENELLRGGPAAAAGAGRRRLARGQRRQGGDRARHRRRRPLAGGGAAAARRLRRQRGRGRQPGRDRQHHPPAPGSSTWS